MQDERLVKLAGQTGSLFQNIQSNLWLLGRCGENSKMVSERYQLTVGRSVDELQEKLTRIVRLLDHLANKENQDGRFAEGVDQFQHETGGWMLSLNSGITNLGRVMESAEAQTYLTSLSIDMQTLGSIFRQA